MWIWGKAYRLSGKMSILRIFWRSRRNRGLNSAGVWNCIRVRCRSTSTLISNGSLWKPFRITWQLELRFRMFHLTILLYCFFQWFWRNMWSFFRKICTFWPVLCNYSFNKLLCILLILYLYRISLFMLLRPILYPMPVITSCPDYLLEVL